MPDYRTFIRTLGLAVATASFSLPASAGATSNDKPHGIPKSTAVAVAPASLPNLVAKWADAWNNCDPMAMAGLFTADGIYDDLAFQERSEGSKGISNWVEGTCKNIVHGHVTILDTVQGDDQIAVQWIFDGTPPAGTPMATGQSFSVPVLTLLRTKGGLIQHDSDYYNLADLLRQLGIPAGPWAPPKD